MNGEYLGIRHIEERIARELIESSKKRYGPVFSLNEEISTVYEKSQFDLSNRRFWNKSNSSIARETLTVLEASKNSVISPVGLRLTRYTFHSFPDAVCVS